MDGLNSTILKNIFIPMHSLQKQIELVETIERRTKSIDDLISIKENKIEELEEYKKSLIFECVTGKKEAVA